MDGQQFDQFQAGGFDLEAMKRQLELAGNGADSKKPRYNNNNGSGGSPPANGSPAMQQRDLFANYGYGPNANLNGGASGFAAPAGYGGQGGGGGAPSLSLNTNIGGMAGGMQMSPAMGSAMNFPASAITQQQAAAMLGYNMLNMGMMNYPMSAGGFAPSGLPSLNISAAANYTAGALSAALNASAANATNRTVYVGSLPPTASVDELLNLVHFGPLENVRVLPEKSCVFLSFLDGSTAAQFHADATIKKLALHGQELKIGWGKPSPVPQQVALAISQSNASRNVYLGGLDEGMTEEQLRDDLSRFGLIDQVKIVRDKNIGFVHFLSITTATKVVNTLPTEPQWAGKRVNYGKDRCAYIPKSQQAAAQSAQVAAAQSLMAQSAVSPTSANPFTSPFSPFTPFGVDTTGGQAMNRTVYLGNVHPETTTEDLCNAIRGGVLQSIRYMQDKHIAFVTFVDPNAAFGFFQMASYQGLTLNNRRLKIGWGKNSGPLPPSLALAVHGGATRNVYIGNIEDFGAFSAEKLQRDCAEYGEIELVNFLREKNCAFVNYTNIASAIKAIDALKAHPEYSSLRIAHGKDRCANAPRQGPATGGGGRRGGGGGQSAVEQTSPVPEADLAAQDEGDVPTHSEPTPIDARAAGLPPKPEPAAA